MSVAGAVLLLPLRLCHDQPLHTVQACRRCSNDGFGGGNVIERNVMANYCRDSGDHVRRALLAPLGVLRAPPRAALRVCADGGEALREW